MSKSYQSFIGSAGSSVKDAALIGRDHVLNVDERVFATVLLEQFKGALDKVSEVDRLPLGVVDLVTDVVVLRLVQVEDGEDLPVVGDESFSDGV